MENIGVLLNDDDVSIVSQAEEARKEFVLVEKKTRSYLICKRLMDICGAIAAIVAFSVPMLLIALMIFLQDFHNPIFKQTRVTKDGRFFTMYKFRTMHIDAERRLKNDPRVTPIGKVLRKTSLDELPQFFNVLGGSMSLVGPRPPLPREVEQYTPYQMHRLDVKGGITCFWQCSGRSNIMFDEWVELDLKYIRERSVPVDVKILLRTVRAVLRKDGAV